jgi:hypothetical protein
MNLQSPVYSYQQPIALANLLSRSTHKIVINKGENGFDGEGRGWLGASLALHIHPASHGPSDVDGFIITASPAPEVPLITADG